MFKLSVSVPQSNSKVLILKGYSEQLPNQQENFSLMMYRDFCKIIIDFGKVYNVKTIGSELLLVQAEHAVVEIEILQGELNENSGKVYYFLKAKNSRKSKQKKSEGVSPASKEELIKMVKDIVKEMDQEVADPPTLKLIKE